MVLSSRFLERSVVLSFSWTDVALLLAVLPLAFLTRLPAVPHEMIQTTVVTIDLLLLPVLCSSKVPACDSSSGFAFLIPLDFTVLADGLDLVLHGLILNGPCQDVLPLDLSQFGDIIR